MNRNQSVYPELNRESIGPRWLVEERDACGVGLIADQHGRASHDLVAKALHALTCMEHRGGRCADRDSGDGAGVMTAIPWKLLQQWATEQNLPNLTPESTGVGMVFLPQNQAAADIVRSHFEQVIKEAGLRLFGWRLVPVDPTVLGVQAKQNQPQIEQVVFQSSNAQGDELERHLYWLRRRVGKGLSALLKTPTNLAVEVIAGLQEYYVCSLSCRTIVYKGMVRSAILKAFYLDLQQPDYVSAFAVYHRRFSTNTLPKWHLAHPMRLIGHNGEINTVMGNINWMMARQADLTHPDWGRSPGRPQTACRFGEKRLLQLRQCAGAIGSFRPQSSGGVDDYDSGGLSEPA